MPRQLNEIAGEILRDWRRPSPYAKPYIEAMLELETIEDRYYADSGRSIVLYFLSNATHWKGEVARNVKAELRALTS